MAKTDRDVEDVMERVTNTLIDTELSAEADVARQWLVGKSN
jgi:hypothetical protein